MPRKSVINPDVTEADEFCSLPIEARELYFHLLVNADSIGAITGAKRLARSYDYGSPSGALQALIDEGYLVEGHEGGATVLFVRHWWAHNKHDARASRGSHYDLAKALFDQVEECHGPYQLKATAESRRNYDGATTPIETATQGEGKETEGNPSERNPMEGKGNGRGSLKGEPPEPIECPTCHKQTLQLFLEQEHPQAQCTNCQTVAYFNPETGELSRMPFGR